MVVQAVTEEVREIPRDVAGFGRYARGLMVRHGLFGWVVKVGNATGQAGSCSHAKRELRFSRHHLATMTDAQVHNLVTHEIAHALLDPSRGHDKVWQAKHRELGGDGQRCHDNGTADRKPTWIGRCPSCGHEARRFRRRRVSCGKCCPRFNTNYLIVWRRASS